MHGYRIFFALGTLILISGCQTWPASDINKLPASAALPATSIPGEVEVYYWDNVTGVALEDLTSLESFPNNPDQTAKLTELQGETSRGDNYGTLVRGYILPLQTGSYRFAVSGDDQTEFWLSTSEDPEKKARIASVTGATNQNQYDKYSSQVSPFTELTAGARYYFEIRHKEGTGADHYSVAWEGPRFGRQLVTGSFIASYSGYSGFPEALPAGEETYRKGYAVGYLDGSEGLAYAPTFPPVDRDGDDLYDNWEIVHGLNPDDPTDANSDPDNDLLVAKDEFLLGTAENNRDSDGDGIPDGDEFAYNLDPLDSTDASGDLDGDGVTNLEEFLAGTNPNVPDAPVVDVPARSGELVYLPGITGQYFQGTSFDQFLIARQETDIQFNAGSGSFVPEQTNDNFSARWYGEFTAPRSSGNRSYTFSTRTDDGARLHIDGEQVISAWRDQGATTYTTTLSLAAGQTVQLLMEYYERGGAAVAQLSITDSSANTNLTLTDVVRSPDLQASSTTDTDGDGIPDVWELRNGLDAWRNDASNIHNRAGITNIEAYQSSISPWTLESVATPNSPSVDERAATEPVTPDLATATLSWTAPFTRVDGSSIALSEIQSYEIVYGLSPDNLSEMAVVDGAQTTAEISGLTSGVWYFAIRVVDTDGLKSENSEVITYRVP